MIDEIRLVEALKKHFDAEYGEDGRLLYSDHVCTGDDVEDIIKLIEEQPKGGEWIPCSERLPDDESIMYWTTHEDGSLVMHGYTKKNGFIYNWEVDDLEKRKRQGDVIAWMPLPLPEPYKENE